jgi:DNA-binding transcriptional MerR regulator
MHTTGEVAQLAGVTVRTLHHYDHIGLLSPGARSESGYRLYTAADLERLQQILFHRDLGFGLDEIRRVMDDPGLDRTSILVEQRRLLEERRTRIEAMIDAVDATITARERGTVMEPEKMFEVFGDFDPRRYQEEAARRWPQTYAESTQRTAGYSKEEWRQALAETDVIAEGLADLLRAGASPTGLEALDLAESHRQVIDRRFYTCTPEMHRGLGQMYTQDARFTEWWDRLEPGLASFVAEAFEANAARLS